MDQPDRPRLAAGTADVHLRRRAAQTFQAYEYAYEDPIQEGDSTGKCPGSAWGHSALIELAVSRDGRTLYALGNDESCPHDGGACTSGPASVAIIDAFNG